MQRDVGLAGAASARREEELEAEELGSSNEAFVSGVAGVTVMVVSELELVVVFAVAAVACAVLAAVSAGTGVPPPRVLMSGCFFRG